MAYEWKEARSASARAGWETRWEHYWETGQFDRLGPKGRDYIDSKYGEEVEGEELPEDYYDEFDYLDIEEEY